MTCGIAYALGGRAYDFLESTYEKRYAPLRKKYLSKLSGKILEIGCGTGRNFEYYSAKAAVNAIDSSSKMLEIASTRVTKSIKLSLEDADKLSFQNNSFDHAVATFVFCVMSRSERKIAIKEAHRVLRTGGSLTIFEYRLAKKPWIKFRMLLTWIVPFALYGLRFSNTRKVKGFQTIKESLYQNGQVAVIQLKKI